MEYIEGELNSIEDDNINSLIMGKACKNASSLTELRCEILGIECYVESEVGCMSYTDRAQDIYNDFYDDEKTELYELLNMQLSVIDMTSIGTRLLMFAWNLEWDFEGVEMPKFIRDIWGDDKMLCNHINEKFIKHDSNIFNFLLYLDKDSRDKVIEYALNNNPKETKKTCGKCKTKFSFTSKDVKSDWRDGNYVNCPKCSAFIAASREGYDKSH